MEPERIDDDQSEFDDQEVGPVCLKCMGPVGLGDDYCPHCGWVCGQYTEYVPFVNIRWQASVWGQMWEQLWSSEVSFIGKVLRLMMIIWCAPIILIGLVVKLFERKEADEQDGEDLEELGD